MTRSNVAVSAAVMATATALVLAYSHRYLAAFIATAMVGGFLAVASETP